MKLIELRSSLSGRDSKKHLEFPFDVAAGTTQLHVNLDYSPIEIPGVAGSNLLSLSLFDAEGCRGAGHCRPINRIDLSAVAATPGYVPGPLQPGRWVVVIDTHMVLPGTTLDFALDVEISNEPVIGQAPVWPKPTIKNRGPGWYRGDLHGHTIHSDGEWDVPDLVAAACAQGLDFVTLSDHNTISPLAQSDSLASDDLLTMGGVELTTYYGHALALGVRYWVDWRVRTGERSMPDIASEVEAAGGTFIIAHPMSPGDPVCTGCDWQYIDMMPGSAKLVEVWNGGVWSDYNEEGLALWYRWLNEGFHLTCTAGTDVHGPSNEVQELGHNIVYANELSESEILTAVRIGHCFVSSGPRLGLVAVNAQGDTAMMGDTLSDELGVITGVWANCAADDEVLLVCNGMAYDSLQAHETGERTWALSSEQVRWCVVEIRATDGRLRAVTNPIWFTKRG